MKIDKEKFQDKKALYKHLVENKKAIINMKRAELKRTEPCAHAVKVLKDVANKGFLFENNEEAGSLKRTIVANTYNWMDAHDDVLVNNSAAKTIKERGANAPHLHDHIFELGAKVGNPIRYFEQEITWKELGLDMPGTTMSLFLESEILKEYNALVYKEYLKNRINQHSIGLRYVKLELAVDDEDYEDEYKVWKAYIDKIGNKDKVMEQGYFFAILEVELIETSAVLLGANELTPTMYQPPEGTDKSAKPLQALDVTKAVEAFTRALK